ncbi:tyrosine-protein kinase SRK2 [Salarias fasciatus]|uniref:Tyrosine-protein kinase n=1 Tax=Salarias fasciatus TaxID=181472 RepID=A0A672I0J6_SALFA|nr:tyrosine-protein kinase FRK [Salarias fasciatus]
MDLSKRLSACWENFRRCFQKPEPQPDPGRRAKTETETDTRVVVITPPSVMDPAPVAPRPQPPGGSVREVYVAQYDYSARTNQDLSFNTGDTLVALDKSPGEWWLARALTGVSASKQGYIPANYVAPVESLDAQPWFFSETRRLESERLLMAEENQHGAFLIRKSESHAGELALSVLDNGKVKHYKVIKNESGQYCVSRNRAFKTLKELVEHYSRQADGLCVQLGSPCKKTEVPLPFSMSFDTVDQWEIDRKSIKLLKKLGAGQFGEVYEGLWNGTTAVAVKTLKAGTMDREDFLREAQIMKTLHHKRLIQLYAVCTMEEPIYIVTELMEHGSLLEYLQKDRGSTLHTSDQIEMAAQVASGMAYLELQNYIHRDLAARNILVGENNICKVADFGLARVFMKESDSVYEAKEGTKFPVKWTAPEAINENKFTIKSDIWSFGILLYEILTFGQMPYPTMTNFQTIQSLSQGYRMPCPPKCPKKLYQIMLDCWIEQAQDRPTFETLQWKLEDFFDLDVSSYDDASPY